MKQLDFLPLRISILVVSDSRTEETDTSGKILTERLTEEGHILAEKCIVPDDIYQIRAVLSRWIVTKWGPNLVQNTPFGCSREQPGFRMRSECHPRPPK